MYLLQIWWSLVLWKWKYQFLYQFLKIPLKRLNSLPWSVILRYFQNQDHSKVPDRASRKTKRRKTHVITKRHAFHANAINFFIKHQWTVACRSMEIKKFSACFAQWKTYLTEEKRYRENYRTEIPRERETESDEEYLIRVVFRAIEKRRWDRKLCCFFLRLSDNNV